MYAYPTTITPHTNSLDECEMFPGKLVPSQIKSLRLPWRRKNQYTWDFWHQIEASCREQKHENFAAEIRRALFRNNIRRVLKRFFNPVRDIFRTKS